MRAESSCAADTCAVNHQGSFALQSRSPSAPFALCLSAFEHADFRRTEGGGDGCSWTWWCAGLGDRRTRCA